LSAVELELFTALGSEAKTGAEIGDRLGLHPRSQFDFLDSLVSLGLLARDGDGPQIPATAAVVLARKLARGALAGGGGVPCLDLFSLDEFLAALDGHAVEVVVEEGGTR
jgi:hypothetical protein